MSQESGQDQMRNNSVSLGRRYSCKKAEILQNYRYVGSEE